MLTKKVLAYEAPHPGMHQEAYYAVDETSTAVCFSWKSGYASPINQAEEIILGICEAEGLDWRNVVFHEIMLQEYYRGIWGLRRIAKYKLTRLVVVENSHNPNYPHTESWTALMSNDSIPAEMLSLFVEIDPYYPWEDEDMVRFYEDDPSRLDQYRLSELMIRA